MLTFIFQPSSCLSDKEEDEIYGFGYGVFGAQMARLQASHRAANAAAIANAANPTATPLVNAQHQNYQR